jgi:hypothetical protein
MVFDCEPNRTGSVRKERRDTSFQVTYFSAMRFLRTKLYLKSVKQIGLTQAELVLL